MATTSQPPHLLLHNLIVALSYWGTTVRTLLFGFLLLVAQLLSITVGDVSATAYVQQFLYIVGSFLLLDAGYVTLAVLFPIAHEVGDRILFLLSLAMLSFVIIIPYFASVPTSLQVSAKWVFLLTIGLLGLRFLVGAILSRKRKS